jgi:hypothetical protein
VYTSKTVACAFVALAERADAGEGAGVRRVLQRQLVQRGVDVEQHGAGRRVGVVVRVGHVTDAGCVTVS